jgi:hypothetical protein
MSEYHKEMARVQDQVVDDAGDPAAASLPQIWGAAYQKRVRGSQFGDECVMCGRRTADSKNTAYIFASPATGKALPASEARTAPVWVEASAYPIGSDCLKRNPALKVCLAEGVR